MIRPLLALLLLSALITNCELSTAQNYIPIPLQNCYWELKDVQTCVNYAMLTGYTEQLYRVYPDSDTLIGTTTYKKFYSQFVSDSIDGYDCAAYHPTTGYLGAMRQDTISRLVYFVFPNQSNEELIYDFNLNAGDSVKTYFGTLVNQPSPYRIVQNVYYQSYSDGSCRKIIKLDPYTVGSPGIGGAGYYDEIIEGIGNNTGVLNTLAGFQQTTVPSFTVTTGITNRLAINNTIISKTTPNTCPQKVELLSAEANLNIYPIPASNTIHISLDKKSITNDIVRIFDVSGKLILESAPGTIDINAIQAGWYLIKYFEKQSAKTYCKSFIKGK